MQCILSTNGPFKNSVWLKWHLERLPITVLGECSDTTPNVYWIYSNSWLWHWQWAFSVVCCTTVLWLMQISVPPFHSFKVSTCFNVILPPFISLITNPASQLSRHQWQSMWVKGDGFSGKFNPVLLCLVVFFCLWLSFKANALSFSSVTFVNWWITKTCDYNSYLYRTFLKDIWWLITWNVWFCLLCNSL